MGLGQTDFMETTTRLQKSRIADRTVVIRMPTRLTEERNCHLLLIRFFGISQFAGEPVGLKCVQRKLDIAGTAIEMRLLLF